MTTASFTAGLLVRGQIRRLLIEARFERQLDEFEEIKGFLDSVFLIRNPSAGLLIVLNSLVTEPPT